MQWHFELHALEEHRDNKAAAETETSSEGTSLGVIGWHGHLHKSFNTPPSTELPYLKNMNCFEAQKKYRYV